jgi:hypothetical protein
MEHDRFDDVAFRMIEEPEPPRRKPPRRRRLVLAGMAAVLAAGALAAGASALSDSGSDSPGAKQQKPAFNSDGVLLKERRDGHPCRRGEGRHHRDRDSGTSALRY